MYKFSIKNQNFLLLNKYIMLNKMFVSEILCLTTVVYNRYLYIYTCMQHQMCNIDICFSYMQLLEAWFAKADLYDKLCAMPCLIDKLSKNKSDQDKFKLIINI